MPGRHHGQATDQQRHTGIGDSHRLRHHLPIHQSLIGPQAVLVENTQGRKHIEPDQPQAHQGGDGDESIEQFFALLAEHHQILLRIGSILLR